VQGRLRRAALAAAATAAAAAAALAPGAVADPREDAVRLREEGAAIASRQRSAVLELYALDSALAVARSEVEGAESRLDSVEARRREVRDRLTVASQTLRTAQRLLAQRVRALYEAGDVDPIASVLEAGSLAGAVGTLEGIAAAAQQDRRILEQASGARERLSALARSLARRSEELRRAQADAAARAGELAAARSARAAYVERLAERRRMNAERIATVERAVELATTRAATTQAAETSDGAPRSGTVTVTATGYSLAGTTATGLRAGWGVVAVDPSFIPLGTSLSIPGYGIGIAADTGSAVAGAHIDLWFPTRAEARAWGRRTIVVALD
jgi:3D (Asp-Asp-Asp) domain-containing protein